MKKLMVLLLALVLAVPAVLAEPEEMDPINAYLNAVDIQYAYDLAYKLSTDSSMHDNEMGFRSAGSDAEHAAADFLAEEMVRIGFQDVEKVPVTVDKWQFNGASMTLADSDFSVMPVSYQVNGTDADGITAQIVDCGTGFAEDYAGKDVDGKIALVGVDQYNEAWINQYIYEAAQHGAAALVTYDIDGYGRWSDDVYQIQDVCCEDLMPTVIITKRQYDQLATEIAAGHDTCTLIVDSVMEIGTGVSYDVVGRIPGKSSAQQQIVSGHYDMYFEGFQDDCSAVAAAMAIGKGIVDSGVQPENDVLIIAHGAEEWGMSGTEFDWTRGAWEMINSAHPEWAGKTLSLFNFELCAFDDGQDAFMISCVPEYRTLVAELVAEGTLDSAVVGRSEGINPITIDTTTMEDGISYRNAGVPYFLNVTDTCIELDLAEGEYSWSQLHYHTNSDDASTYDETTMRNNIGVFGAILLTIDREPALRLDLTQACLDLDAAMEMAYAEEAGVDVQAWKDGMAAMLDAAKAHNAKIADINARYASAKDDAARKAIRAEGVALNAKTLEAFKFVQDAFIGIEFSSDVVQRHEGYLHNVEILDAVIEALEAGELSNDDGTGALDVAYGLNALSEYGYYIFTPEAADMQGMHADAALGNSQLWGKGKGFVYAQTWPATVSLLQKAETGENDFTEELAIYRAEREKQLVLMGEAMEKEIAAMAELTSLLAD